MHTNKANIKSNEKRLNYDTNRRKKNPYQLIYKLDLLIIIHTSNNELEIFEK